MFSSTPFGPLARMLPLWTSEGPARPRERSCRVDGRRLGYGEIAGGEPRAGSDEPVPSVVLVHGWGVTHSSYTRAALALAGHGFRVLMPDLPGFGRSSDLPLRRVSLASFASILQGFLSKVDGGSSVPAHVVGHSFGGAVSARLAHDAPELVASLVLVDAATGATWSRGGDGERPLSERPLWDWALHLVHEFPLGESPGTAASVLRDLGHNLVWHLPSLGLVAHLARRFDLRAELGRVAEMGIPVSVVWAEGDRVVTRACYEDQCAAVGRAGTVVAGNHGWPMTDPVTFGRVVAQHLRDELVT